MVLSKLQKIKFLLVTIIFILFVQGLFAQDWQKIWNDYLDGQDISKELEQADINFSSNPYFLTLAALHKSNGEKAFLIYQKAIKLSKDEKLSQFINDKMGDYYYASGLYETAKKFQVNSTKDLKKTNISQTNINFKSNIYLQYGVFSNKENALRFIGNNKVSTLKFDIKIINNKFYVITGPYDSKYEATLVQSELKSQRRKLKPFIKRF